MNKSALQDIQQALNAIRSEIERVDDETKWAALELMLGTSSSVVALAKKMAKPETKTVTRTVAVPKTKIVSKNHSSRRHQKTQNEQTSHLFVHNHRYQINKTTEINAENTSKVHGL
jgi:hypothetical protein